MSSRRVVVLTFPGVQSLDVIGPVEVFANAGAYAIEVVAPRGGTVTMSNGLGLTVAPLPTDRRAIDTLVVAGGTGTAAAEGDEALLRWLRAASGRARRTSSVCTGAFLLAASGLLDGRRATTHWAYCGALAERYPQVAVDPDPIFVRDGLGTVDLLGDERMLHWIRGAHATASWTTSVCTGSLLLAAAGLLDGLEATMHWAVLAMLSELGARPVSRRVVEQGRIVTAAGVSSGIDMALTLAARVAGEDTARAIQLGIEYDPQPPFDCGSPEKAGEEIVALAMQVLSADAAADPAAPAG